MIRCVVFDFDGTLVESNHIKRQTFIELAGGFKDGADLMEDILRRADNRDRYWVFDQFVTALPVEADAKKLAERYTQTCEEKIARAPEISGAAVSLKRLEQEGKLLFVNSATPVAPLIKLIRLRRMETWFKGVYGSPRKKHENLEVIKSQHSLRSDEIVVVGDGESDRIAAETLGCHFIGIENSENNFSQKPAILIANLTGLPSIISSMQLN